MQYHVKSYNFFKANNGYEAVNNGVLCHFSVAMFECLKQQYILNGYKVTCENDCFVCFIKVLNELDVFTARLANN